MKMGYLASDWVLDMHYLLNEHLKIPEFHVMGASMGTVHAANLATLFLPAHKVRNVVLYVAFAPEDQKAGHDPLQGSMLKSFQKMNPRALRLLSKLLINPLMRLFLPKDANVIRSFKWQWEGGMDTCNLIYQPWPASWTAMASRAGGRKVTIVSGTKDTMCLPHNQRRLADLIKSSTLIEYEGDHARGLEKPEMMTAHLDQALA